MTHEDFRRLHKSGEITVKEFAGEASIKSEGALEKNVTEQRVIEAFEYGGKYYLRLHVQAQWSIYRDHGKVQGRLKRVRDDHFIKEFETKVHANNYYKKFTEGFTMRREH